MKTDSLNTLEKIGKTNLMLNDPNEDIRGHEVFDSAGEKPWKSR